MKFVQSAEQITYPVQAGVAERGQKAKIVTERAVFDVAADGLVLSEVAPGIDIRRDVLEQMEFAPVRILEPISSMSAALFKP